MADASAFQELQNSSKLSSHLEEEERMDENPNMVERKDIEIDSDEDDIIGNRGIHCSCLLYTSPSPRDRG